MDDFYKLKILYRYMYIGIDWSCFHFFEHRVMNINLQIFGLGSERMRGTRATSNSYVKCFTQFRYR